MRTVLVFTLLLLPIGYDYGCVVGSRSVRTCYRRLATLHSTRAIGDVAKVQRVRNAFILVWGGERVRRGGEEGQQPGKASIAPYCQTDYMRATNHLQSNGLTFQVV